MQTVLFKRQIGPLGSAMAIWWGGSWHGTSAPYMTYVTSAKHPFLLQPWNRQLILSLSRAHAIRLSASWNLESFHGSSGRQLGLGGWPHLAGLLNLPGVLLIWRQHVPTILQEGSQEPIFYTTNNSCNSFHGRTFRIHMITPPTSCGYRKSKLGTTTGTTTSGRTKGRQSSRMYIALLIKAKYTADRMKKLIQKVQNSFSHDLMFYDIRYFCCLPVLFQATSCVPDLADEATLPRTAVCPVDPMLSDDLELPTPQCLAAWSHFLSLTLPTSMVRPRSLNFTIK